MSVIFPAPKRAGFATCGNRMSMGMVKPEDRFTVHNLRPAGETEPIELKGGAAGLEEYHLHRRENATEMPDAFHGI